MLGCLHSVPGLWSNALSRWLAGTTEDADMNTIRNPVAKYQRKFNKARVQVDRKKAARRGHLKHRGVWK